MRGTLAATDSRHFPSELRRFLGETLQSPAAERMRRFKPFAEPDSLFPLEGTLKSHSTGSYIRGNWILRDEPLYARLR